MSLKLRPLADRVIVEPQDKEETFAGGALVLPETAKEKPQQGLILAVGPGRRDDDGAYIKMDINTGDTVLFAKYAGTEVKVDGKKLLILKETDILAVVDNK
ncbi:MAG: 10 kDa chaperonin 3 [Chloroflexota bacterium]|nr:co-chaperone GroES [Chloroflexota bacterium]NOG66145.1 co-chaperone GroES [Chloroflexota bacterium]GIK63761.1 MAG: 10 kDa chaperonin 3 [Chloroflexota bacterium]